MNTILNSQKYDFPHFFNVFFSFLVISTSQGQSLNYQVIGIIVFFLSFVVLIFGSLLRGAARNKCHCPHSCTCSIFFVFLMMFKSQSINSLISFYVRGNPVHLKDTRKVPALIIASVSIVMQEDGCDAALGFHKNQFISHAVETLENCNT